MNKQIKTASDEYIGLPQEIFSKKPSKLSDFEFSRELNYFNEPENIIEELNGFYKKIVNLFTVKQVINEV